jgi:hypothetical protein
MDRSVTGLGEGEWGIVITGGGGQNPGYVTKCENAV